MQTIKIISNISYNSIEFFTSVITKLQKDGVIEWCYWIYHEADNDETKPHIHFVLKPSARIDTTKLRVQFFEFTPYSDLPLCCTTKWNFTNSMDDWLLYAVHDIGYLASKGQFRNIHYNFSDLHATDFDALKNDWNAINRLKYERLAILQEAVDTNTPFAILVQNGIVPISQRAQYEAQFQALKKIKFDNTPMRNLNHEQQYNLDFDNASGEIKGFTLDNTIDF